MFRSTYQIARVWGIPIRIHLSLVLLLLYVALNLGMGSGLPGLVVAILLVAGVFSSIALHELGHSFVALRTGARVREITLMFMGGAARMEHLPRRPRDELLMALAGPAVSVALGGIFILAGNALRGTMLAWPGAFIRLLGILNLYLAGFNLLPSFPMDGGRVLRAALTPRLGRVKATFIAARLGRILAILFGLYGFLAEPRRWILVAVAFFIYSAAGREYEMVRAEHTVHRDRPPGPWPFGPPPGAPGGRPEPGDDEVVIGPPPYER